MHTFDNSSYDYFIILSPYQPRSGNMSLQTLTFWLLFGVKINQLDLPCFRGTTWHQRRTISCTIFTPTHTTTNKQDSFLLQSFAATLKHKKLMFQLLKAHTFHNWFFWDISSADKHTFWLKICTLIPYLWISVFWITTINDNITFF